MTVGPVTDQIVPGLRAGHPGPVGQGSCVRSFWNEGRSTGQGCPWRNHAEAVLGLVLRQARVSGRDQARDRGRVGRVSERRIWASTTLWALSGQDPFSA